MILFQHVFYEKIPDLIYSQFVDYMLYQLLHDICSVIPLMVLLMLL